MGRRRMPGEGSIFQKTVTLPDGRTRVRWHAQLSVGEGRQRQFRTRTCRTQREAIAALGQLKADRVARRNPSGQSLGAYLRWWLDETARPTVSPNTYRGYEDAIAHLAPIAGVPLDRLTAEDIEQVCNRMTSRRGKGAGPAAPKTVRNVQIMLRGALGHAERRGHVRTNAASLVPLRRVPHIKREALTPERARAVLIAARDDRYEAAINLACLALRESEILGLAWSDIDLGPSPVVNLRYQLHGSGKHAVRRPLKTVASASPVPLPPFIAEQLRAHRARQEAERPFVPLDADGLVFVTERGYAVSGSWLTKHFQALLERAGLPRMRFHDLRHGAATLLVAAGVPPRVVQELLRHANSRTTMDIYTHVSAGQQREAANVLQRLLADDQSTDQSPGLVAGVNAR